MKKGDRVTIKVENRSNTRSRTSVYGNLLTLLLIWCLPPTNLYWAIFPLCCSTTDRPNVVNLALLAWRAVILLVYGNGPPGSLRRLGPRGIIVEVVGTWTSNKLLVLLRPESRYFTRSMTWGLGSLWKPQEPFRWIPLAPWTTLDPRFQGKYWNGKHFLIWHPNFGQKCWVTKMAITPPNVDGFSTS